MIGCATALELATAGCAVTLIERGRVGAEASWAGAGLLSALLPWDYRREVMDLLEWSRRLYPAWVASLDATTDVEFRVSGLLVLPPYSRDAAHAWADQYDQTAEDIYAREVAPELAFDSPALWMPKIAQVRNPRLMQALRHTLNARGVRVCEGVALEKLLVDGAHVTGIETSTGTVTADTFVLAAGAWSTDLLKDYRAAASIKPMRGQIVLYKDSPGRLPTILYRDGYYLIPRDDGHILVGSTLEDVGFDKSATVEARELFTARARDLLPWLGHAQQVAHWAGLRPATPENIPVISRHPQLENLYLNSGHYRYGVTMAPASARLLADLLLNRPSQLDPGPYAWPI